MGDHIQQRLGQLIALVHELIGVAKGHGRRGELVLVNDARRLAG